MKAAERFAAEYTQMRRWNFTHDQIAREFGIQRDSLLRRITRTGTTYIPEPHERELWTALDAFIASGREFRAADLPEADQATRTAVLVRARWAGRIEVVRTLGLHTKTHRVSVYRGVVADQAVAS